MCFGRKSWQTFVTLQTHGSKISKQSSLWTLTLPPVGVGVGVGGQVWVEESRFCNAPLKMSGFCFLPKTYFFSGKSFFLAHFYTLIFVSQLSIPILFLCFTHFQTTLRHLHVNYYRPHLNKQLGKNLYKFNCNSLKIVRYTFICKTWTIILWFHFSKSNYEPTTSELIYIVNILNSANEIIRFVPYDSVKFKIYVSCDW